MNVVPIDAADLADWAVRLYDEYLRRPDLIRLATWARLERRPTGHLVEDHDRLDDHKLRVIAEAQAAGAAAAVSRGEQRVGRRLAGMDVSLHPGGRA
ncbi:hypothetical protein AB0B54_30340 [Microbispora bryophytorum]|uniref:hypothetical protein n=1 Tax=Microbispora bryophytorum TaxID=1460882 RepID=UPI0033F51A4A